MPRFSRSLLAAAAAFTLTLACPHPAAASDSGGATAAYDAETRELTISVGEVPRYRYRFNKGGAINGIYDLKIAPDENLIGESFQGETTDRVIQWTYWNARYEAKPHDLGDKNVRANVTMEGCFHEAATCEVLATPASGAVRELVFVSRIEHWFYKILDRHGQPRFDTTSRYEVLADGSLRLTRSVVRHTWDLKNVTVKTKSADGWERREVESVRLEAKNLGKKTRTSYFEGWTPFRRTVLPHKATGAGRSRPAATATGSPETSAAGRWRIPIRSPSRSPSSQATPRKPAPHPDRLQHPRPPQPPPQHPPPRHRYRLVRRIPPHPDPRLPRRLPEDVRQRAAQVANSIPPTSITAVEDGARD
ncbi:MAG: hypothetical protein R3F11_01025 [Verrucomicrobiales bacterium]